MSSKPQQVLERDEDQLRERVRIAWWVWLLLALTLVTIAVPLIFGGADRSSLGWMTLTIAIALAVACAAAIATYIFIGTNRAVNAVAAIILICATGYLAYRGKELSDESHARIEQQALAAVRTAQIAFRAEVTYSSSGWWEYEAPTVADQLAAPIARFPHTAVTRLVQASLPVITELEAAEADYRRAVREFHDAGGLSAASLKTRDACDKRIAALRAIEAASTREMDLFRAMAEHIDAHTKAVDCQADLRAATIGTLASGNEIAAALSIHQLDHDYVDRAIRYVDYLKKNSGKWSLISKDNTIYLGYDLQKGEFITLQRQVNDIADKQRGIQRSTLNIPDKVVASGKGRGTDLTGSSDTKPSDRAAEAHIR